MPGKSGRKPKPSVLRHLEGNRSHQSKAAFGRVDPKGMGQPLCPPSFDARQRAIWREIVASMPDGIYSRADSSLLEQFVICLGTIRECSAMIGRTGLMVRGRDGNAVRNPLLGVRRAAQTELRSLAAELGLSPVSRTRLAKPPEEAPDPMELLLGDGADAGGWGKSTAVQ